MSSRIRILFAVLVVHAVGTLAPACNIPVFRYALERWQPDVSEVVVYHDATIDSSQRARIEKLKSQLSEDSNGSNAKLIVVDVDAKQASLHAELWSTMPKTAKRSLPQVIVRTKVGLGRWVNHECRPLESVSLSNLLRSPVRSEIRERILKGHAIVWLMLRCGDSERDAAARDMLTGRFDILAKQIKMPEGIGLPGSELFADVPLVLKFSLIEIDDDDPQEQFLIGLLRGLQPGSAKQRQPLLVPVFGRGRALEVIPADNLTESLIDDLTMFLSAACSCQVKEQNPGFDLLIQADWDDALFDDDGDRPPDRSLEEGQNRPPILLTIPPGRGLPASNAELNENR